MDFPDENITLPTAPGLSWRSLQTADVSAINALATMCLEADGGLPLDATDTYIQKHYLPGQPGASIGAFDMDGRLAACAAVQPTHTPEEYRATIVGQVAPSIYQPNLIECSSGLSGVSREQPASSRATRCCLSWHYRRTDHLLFCDGGRYVVVPLIGMTASVRYDHAEGLTQGNLRTSRALKGSNLGKRQQPCRLCTRHHVKPCSS